MNVMSLIYSRKNNHIIDLFYSHRGDLEFKMQMSQEPGYFSFN